MGQRHHTRRRLSHDQVQPCSQTSTPKTITESTLPGEEGNGKTTFQHSMGLELVRVARVRAEYPSQLDYSLGSSVPETFPP